MNFKNKFISFVLGFVLAFNSISVDAGYRGKQSVPGDNLWEIVSATGGTITNSGGYTIHTFTSSGNFTITAARPVNSLANPIAGAPNAAGAEVLIDVLLVGAGGAGGVSDTGNPGGGGGGGEVIDFQNKRIPLRYDAMPVVVGVGPNGVSAATPASPGGYSSFHTWVARGGGAGIATASGTNVTSTTGGNSGGYNGNGTNTAADAYNLPTDDQGIGSTCYAGGGAGSGAAGGGAGAGGVGQSGQAANGGAGGNGVASSISGASVTYGGGGGGGEDAADTGGGGAGGAGGGGQGGTDGAGGSTPGDGTDGLGGGGGGRGEDQTTATAGDGGDGVVVIRYKTI